MRQFWNVLKDDYGNREKVENTPEDIPDFRDDFCEFLDEGKKQFEVDGLNEDNLSHEIDHCIASGRGDIITYPTIFVFSPYF